MITEQMTEAAVARLSYGSAVPRTIAMVRGTPVITNCSSSASQIDLEVKD